MLAVFAAFETECAASVSSGGASESAYKGGKGRLDLDRVRRLVDDCSV
jgi:hypothetical protein